MVHPIPSAAPAWPMTHPGALARALRGFSFLLWGLFLMAVLLPGALRISAFGRYDIPAYLLGVPLLLAGTYSLSIRPGLTRAWRNGVRRMRWLALLLAYFAPFLTWREIIPNQPYFSANALLFYLCVAAALWQLNRLAGELGQSLHNRPLRTEARWNSWLSVAQVFMGIGAGLYRSYAEVSAEAMDPGETAAALLAFFPHAPALGIFFGLPCALTFLVLWRARMACRPS